MIIGNKNIYFEVCRPGTNTTIQDSGRNHLYHLGITVSGAVDQKNFKLSNLILNNNINEGVIEFAFQGPLLKLYNGKVAVCISGEIIFDVIRNNSSIEKGNCYQIYYLNHGDQIDIKSTKNSLYGYLAIKGGFNLKKIWNSYSINTKAGIGPNNGKKFSIGEKIFIKNEFNEVLRERQIGFENSREKVIRVMKGTNFDFFSEKSKKIFFTESFKITNLVDRMGIRLSGPELENIVNTNIRSEGIIKGTIQVPADGNPIIMLADHGTIGGYPKIATVISADLDNIAQLMPNSEVNFKEVNLEEAEELYKKYLNEIDKYAKNLNEFN